ncbi:cytochrome protein [Xylaria bambusicola]|uniref:cytochrome protein n=1 Tax=Xylaria bambusicola TaxID=326684 RepID=UPI002008CCDC|nr:cytochrome protein [Xylaria bambusicola]KAI0517762.1 cytochrome protein [Xylaria bambusicola]
MATHLVISLLVATVVVIGIKIFLDAVKQKPGPLPPGPKGWPILGNINDFPKAGEREYEHWLKHKDTYGPISSVTALGTTQVILHSAELAIQMLEKRSSIYSSRPKLVFAKLCRFYDIFSLLPYNKQHQVTRKLLHTALGTEKLAARYIHIQEKEAHRFLFRVLQKPDLLFDHIKVEAAAIILKMVYGYTVEPHKPDPLVQVVDEAMTYFSETFAIGARLVDFIPALQHVPEWVPGTGWKQYAKKCHATVTAAVEMPLRFARKRHASGDFEPNMVSEFYDSRGDEVSAEVQHCFQSAATTAYFGGSDTTVNTLCVFFYCIMNAPEVQRKAQEEIDRVIGNGRLPEYSDKDSLPYISAIVSESFRWHTVVPMAAPHTTEADDVVNGYYIPKGTTILPNVWWFTNDPAVYPNPSEFNPARFLGPNPNPDPSRHIWGYGRRICPGRYLAISSTWVTIARTLAVFDIGRGIDENGHEIEEPMKIIPGLIHRVEPFKATFKPRSPQHEALIRQAEALYPWEQSNADELEHIVT